MSLREFIKKSPTQYHATAAICEILAENSFTELRETDEWSVSSGGKYYVTRNGSSVIAFTVPAAAPQRFMISASHCDSPCFKIKENAVVTVGKYQKLATERYGGTVNSTWLDRPLSIAGRITVKKPNGIEIRNIDFGRACAVIPNVASHLLKNMNDGVKYNPAVDLLALYSADESHSFYDDLAMLADVSKDDILSTDIQLYVCEDAVEYNDLISAPRLDDLQCVYASLEAFKNAVTNNSNINMLCVFDNEEVGSSTKQGADSTFLADTLTRLCGCLDITEQQKCMLAAQSMMLSCDNAHAIHPNQPSLSDANNGPVINGGVVIKYNANQKYTSDAVSSGIFKVICEKAGVPVQTYANRADLPGGSTLGNISNTKFSLNTVDIGIAQLAMHSAFETSGNKDTEYFIKAVSQFYNTEITVNGNNINII